MCINTCLTPVLCIEEHVGLIISLDRDPVSLNRTFPLASPADKTSDRHSSQRVQSEGKSASIQSSAGDSVEVHHSLFSCSTSVSVVERNRHISCNLCQCNSFDDGIRTKRPNIVIIKVFLQTRRKATETHIVSLSESSSITIFCKWKSYFLLICKYARKVKI